MPSLRDRIRTLLARRLQVPEVPRALERLAGLGFSPAHILDVGAYRGDFARECLRVWPDARISCFEPLPSRVADLEALVRSHRRIRVYRCLVGAEVRDKVALHEAETASSVLPEWQPNQFPVHEYPMETIDHLFAADPSAPPPEFLKIDVQGYELEVLKGAERTLSSLRVVLTEVNLLDIHQHVPLLDELVAWMSARSWAVYDVAGLTRRPLDRALWQVDLVFVPRESAWRSDKRWGT
jgi:FkbM family methyltransferase